ncbi:3-oxoacyl-[acyl-carrier-protein] reductase [bacterium (Candidatus Blackallbacteria) CG17_big_fil_post_rev_8_21_14_2_50_48_46]|uniref:3-oxoacyl-[acyl-carrier-protein] reductase n=1 Tax=bacterium (Candidatus Blackallbacteria) CG17_big_fil_post_rev_8_21_14_2_50_48_46 TaxID=2014261 RepID=A0A2M7G139_9BACT|nr:MAG: 3-oxoacyl-[acyl-carrier-protein] reductase [bacterium (Candidatus Blackallbacteria) CG18_big_fil_WC_8_21_14_2_50_49_26]PIW15421.1 MAG: 3-oxoacyl-[acyl-carrier-protein] reductase [bacterium (Candidatus Blackallbacteria) CG17_big_fil_post_rev_8_21_14_2_50_48_46]PIW49718.1 MAG: 3-oxoacyl-[acyl-carrier-protein] reductase [bacterium (Candidatus Blackallbacteria) CG13_big_fil_rev_8_21_14_2_50_49_14]
MAELSGKVALVTGSSRGIGRACVLKLAEAGARVVINYFSHEEAAREVQALIAEKWGGESLCIRADISQAEQVQALFDQIMERWGRLDILVNNAGITRDGLLLRMQESDWDDVVSTNLRGLFHCTKRAAKIMLRQKSGRIVNLSSVVGQIGNEGQTNYATTKAGILGFTRSVALELASRGIAVNAVAPGYIDSEMTDGLTEAKRAEVIQKIPFQRFGRCDEVAEMVLFLSSERCQYLTGQTINIDGGMVMK